MRVSDYLKRYERILESDMLEELSQEKKEHLLAKLLEDIYLVLNSSLHQQNMELKDEEELSNLYSKITTGSKYFL